MSSESIIITISVECSDEKFAEIITKSLEPENSQLDNKSDIDMILEDRTLTIKLSTSSPIPTIRKTVDDIINTISTSGSIYKTVKRKKN